MKNLVNVGLVLDFNSSIGVMSNTCISMAISDFYATHSSYKTRLSLHTRNSQDVVGAAFAAMDLINNEEVNAIVGPQTSMQANFVISLGEKAQVPIISISATSPSLSTTENKFFIRTALDDGSQVEPIASLVQAYGWQQAVFVYENTEYGNGLVPYLAYEFQQFNIQKVINNLSRFVLIIWIFVVLILTQSYTASLASMLTVQRLQPAVVDVDELKTNGDFVGHRAGSYIKEFLIKQLHFDPSKLRHYSTPEEFDEALSRGSQNGGVSAIFEAEHILQLFLPHYCSKFMTTGPTYKTDGLGFVNLSSPIPSFTYLGTCTLLTKSCLKIKP
ncbi:hypothetical protein SLEP1_g13193 [Rubroshorea leprosula]|uniref:Receptor ligand binding region domain-containing protein n=1 Tax=Rubroshorea leprosula TaxID=152421 RepID=A0AAV5IQK4_9ROSI|nr:hypothetical protein SLEP1_g13193 [Rubroshorea leprosula]